MSRSQHQPEISKLVIAVRFKARAYADSQAYFRCEEQMELQALLAGMDYREIQVEMPAVWAVAAAGQGMTAFAEAGLSVCPRVPMTSLTDPLIGHVAGTTL